MYRLSSPLRAELSAMYGPSCPLRAELSTGRVVHGPSCPRAELSGNRYGVGPPFSRRVCEMVQILTGAIYIWIFFYWTESISYQIVFFFFFFFLLLVRFINSDIAFFIGLFPFHWHPHLSRVASKSGTLLSLRHSAYTLWICISQSLQFALKPFVV